MTRDRIAVQRCLAALAAFGQPEPVSIAFAPDGRVLRHGWDANRGRVLETFTGHDDIAAWCARSPRNVTFELAGAPTRRGEELEARYLVRVGDYQNQGTWRLRLAEDGRVAQLEHQPDDLPDEWREGVPEGKSLGPPPAARPHDHAHAHDHQQADGEE